MQRADGALELVLGKGAGRWPTAGSLLGDLLELARDRRVEALARDAAGESGGIARAS